MKTILNERKKIKWYLYPILIPIAIGVLYAIEKREKIKQKAKDGTLTIWDLL